MKSLPINNVRKKTVCKKGTLLYAIRNYDASLKSFSDSHGFRFLECLETCFYLRRNGVI